MGSKTIRDPEDKPRDDGFYLCLRMKDLVILIKKRVSEKDTRLFISLWQHPYVMSDFGIYAHQKRMATYKQPLY